MVLAGRAAYILKRSCDHWRTYGRLAANPGFEYNFLADDEALDFLRSIEPSSQVWAESFGSLRLGAMRADLLRLVWLEKYGGFYIDQVGRCAE